MNSTSSAKFSALNFSRLAAVCLKKLHREFATVDGLRCSIVMVVGGAPRGCSLASPAMRGNVGHLSGVCPHSLPRPNGSEPGCGGENNANGGGESSSKYDVFESAASSI